MEIIIRNAVENDLEAILKIVNHAILHTTSNYSYDIQSLADQKKWFIDKKDKGLPILVAKFQNQVLGFATYGSFREKIGYQYTIEHSVYVIDDYIGKGIGKLLLSKLIYLAKKQGYHCMIGAIDATNQNSIQFHQKFGFQISGHIKEVGFKFNQWLDLVLMQLILQ